MAAVNSALVKIEVYSHHLKVSNFNRRVKDALLDYCKHSMGQYGLIKKGTAFRRAVIKVFVAVTFDREEFRFHVNQLQDIIRQLGRFGIKEEQIWMKYHGLYRPPLIEYRYIDPREPRNYQNPIIDYIVDTGKIKLVTLDPGQGKTFIALKAISILETRVVFIIKSMYIEKWVNDIKEAFDVDPGDILVVSGSKSFKKLITLGKEKKLTAKFILCSNMTVFQYFKAYEFYGKQILKLGYDCLPEDFYKTLGCGFRIVDEVHQDKHFNFRLDLFTHVPKTLSLSGTLESGDRFIDRIYSIMFPHEIRYKGVTRDVYVKVEAFFYEVHNVEERIKYVNPALKSYSHMRFEKSILKQKNLLNSYLGMIANIVQTFFIKERQDGQKVIIYFSTVKMCTAMAEKLQHIHPTLSVNRYVMEDDYEEMLESDIIVSTLKSLGTAIDVPGLKTVIMTDALGSMQANLQCMGRLRRLKDWPEISPTFVYLCVSNIPKHVDYHRKKQEIFRGRVKSHREYFSPYRL